MPTMPYFFQECPTCGRHARIRVEYLGRRVTCLHCQGRFLASDKPSRFDAAHLAEPPAGPKLTDLLGFVAAAPNQGSR